MKRTLYLMFPYNIRNDHMLWSHFNRWLPSQGHQQHWWGESIHRPSVHRTSGLRWGRGRRLEGAGGGWEARPGQCSGVGGSTPALFQLSTFIPVYGRAILRRADTPHSGGLVSRWWTWGRSCPSVCVDTFLSCCSNWRITGSFPPLCPGVPPRSSQRQPMRP